MAPPPIPQDLQLVFNSNNITIDNTIGILLIAFTASVFLFGLVSFQVHHYHRNYPKDPTRTKCLVGVVWFCDLGQTVFQLHGLYSVLISNFGDLNNILDPVFTMKVSLLWAAVIYALVQGYFGYRIKVLSGCYSLALFCWFGAAARFALNVTADAISLTMSLFDFETKRVAWIHAPMITGVVLDIIIALALSYYLYSRSRGGMPGTKWIARRLILFALETGILTSMSGLAAVITCCAMPHNSVWLAILFFHSKIYSNSLLLSLNLRIDLQKRKPGSPKANISLASAPSYKAGDSIRKPAERSDNVVVKVNRIITTIDSEKQDDLAETNEIATVAESITMVGQEQEMADRRNSDLGKPHSPF